jgi:hypothetical protein
MSCWWSPSCGEGTTAQDGKCVWDLNPDGSPQNCNDARDTCDSFCSSHGGYVNFSCVEQPGGAGSCECRQQKQCQSCLPNGSGCGGNPDCCSNVCDINNVCVASSPILINLSDNSSNYHMTTAINGVPFDIDANGDIEQLSWTEPDSDVAFLVWDRNGNGQIDNGSELFGDATLKSNGEPALNGFEALIDLDGNAASDGRIDSSDAAYTALRLWLDRNHNGISEGHELQTLHEAGVTTIFTAYRESRRVDRNGNSYRYVGRALVRTNGRDAPRKVFDVYLSIMQD